MEIKPAGTRDEVRTVDGRLLSVKLYAEDQITEEQYDSDGEVKRIHITPINRSATTSTNTVCTSVVDLEGCFSTCIAMQWF